MNSIRSVTRTRWTIVVVLNIVSAVIPGIFGIMGLVAPASRPGFSDEVTGGVAEYASLYGIRSLVLAVVLLVLLAQSMRSPRAGLVPVLLIAGVIQVGDSLLIIATGNVGQLAGPLICAVTHLATVVWLSRPGTLQVGTASA